MDPTSSTGGYLTSRNNCDCDTLPLYSTSDNTRVSEWENNDGFPRPPAPLAETSALVLPPSFKIGTQEVPPLLSVSQLQGHVKLIGAIYKLREEKVKGTSMIDSLSVYPQSIRQALEEAFRGMERGLCGVPQEVIWAVYLARAVDRFQVWHNNVLDEDDHLTFLAPLDVLMVWHAFLLNPVSYHEDSLLRFPKLYKINGIDTERLAKYIDPDTFAYNPPDMVKDIWVARTQESYEASIVPPSAFHIFKCPSCNQQCATPYMTPDETGWIQDKFSHTCTCDLVITKTALGVFKLAQTACKFVRWKIGLDPSIRPTLDCFLSPLPLDREGLPDYDAAEAKAARWFRIAILHKTTNPKQLAEEWGWGIDRPRVTFCLAIMATTKMKVTPKIVLKTLAAYRQPIASIDLGAAVNRQFSFIKKCVEDLGWTQPHRFERDPTILLRSIARYHAFLDLMQSSPASFCVPTLDIDLAWHTHQLYDKRYRKQTLLYVGLTPNHDDKVEENTLSTSFDVTARAWKERFGVPYSTCGCTLPEDSFSSKFKKKIGRSKDQAPDTLIHSNDPEHASSTHASEHNSVFLLSDHNCLMDRMKREKDLIKRLAKEQRLIERGRADTNTLARGLQRERQHKEAFYMDLAIPRGYWGVNYGYVSLGYGYYGLAGCGHVVSGGGNRPRAGGAGGSCGGSTGGCGGSACGGGGSGGCGGGGCGGGGGGCGGS